MPIHIPPHMPANLIHPPYALTISQAPQLDGPPPPAPPPIPNLPAIAIPATISRLGLGCGRIGSLSNPTSLDDIRHTLAIAPDLGVTLFDTAGIYGNGDSEREIGRVLKPRAAEIFIITKIGRRTSMKGRIAASAKNFLRPFMTPATCGIVAQQRRASIRLNYEPQALMSDLNRSLTRLNLDHVGAVLLHSPPGDIIRQDETIRTLEQIRQSGKATMTGVSCDHLSSAEAALQSDGVSLIQMPITLYHQLAAHNLITAFQDKGIGILLRGVIATCAPHSPRAAVAAATRLPGVWSVIAGASHPAHLTDIAAGLAHP